MMDRNQDQNQNEDRGTDRDPDARTAAGAHEPSHHVPGAGITNRPDEIERENQERLPPRGQEKAGD